MIDISKTTTSYVIYIECFLYTSPLKFYSTVENLLSVQRERIMPRTLGYLVVVEGDMVVLVRETSGAARGRFC